MPFLELLTTLTTSREQVDAIDGAIGAGGSSLFGKRPWRFPTHKIQRHQYEYAPSSKVHENCACLHVQR